MKVEELNIDDLKPYALNAKKHPQSQLEGIAESIRRFGFTQPIVIDDKNEIIIGHGRHAAAKIIGYTKVPCVKLDQLDERQVRALRLIDNRIAETGWEHELLAEEMKDLDFDFSSFNVNFDFATPTDVNLDQFFEQSEKSAETKLEKLSFEFDKETMERVVSELGKHGETNEAALLKLLGIVS